MDAKILLPLACLFLFIPLASASWESPQITLKPGTWQVVEFTNSENTAENLAITNISAPNELLPYVFVTPSSIPPLSSEGVTVQFAYVPISVREGIPQDVYAVKVGGLLVYLDLTENVETLENVWLRIGELQLLIDDIQSQIDAIDAPPDLSLEVAELQEWAENFLIQIQALESVPVENWAGEIENLQQQLDEMKTENSDRDNELGVLEQRLITNFSNALANAKEEAARRAERGDEKTRELADDAKLYGIAGIGIGVVLLFAIFGYPYVKKMQKPVLRRQESGIPLGDKIVMLENEIAAMTERGEDTARKKLELTALKAQSEFEKADGG